MDRKWQQRLIERFNHQRPWKLSVAILLVGVLLIGVGFDEFGRITKVGILYTALGVGLLLNIRSPSDRLHLRNSAIIIGVGLCIAFMYLLFEMLVAQLAYKALTVELVKNTGIFAFHRWLDLLLVGGLFLLGTAHDERNRQILTAGIVTILVFLFWLEILDSYAAAFWPVSDLLLYIGLIIGVLIAGLPLYIVGGALSISGRPSAERRTKG